MYPKMWNYPPDDNWLDEYKAAMQAKIDAGEELDDQNKQLMHDLANPSPEMLDRTGFEISNDGFQNIIGNQQTTRSRTESQIQKEIQNIKTMLWG